MTEHKLEINFTGLIPRTRSELVLLGANLAALAFSVYGGWGVSHLLWLYSGETLAMGLINILKIFLAAKPVPLTPGERPMIRPSIWKAFLAMIFCCAFGIFFMIQNMFLYNATFGTIGYTLPEGAKAVFSDITVPLILLAFSHLVSFFLNYLPRERFNLLPEDCMQQLFPRVLFTYPAIGFGALAMKFLGGGAAALAIFMLLKVSFDIKAHKMERERQGGGTVEGVPR